MLAGVFQSVVVGTPGCGCKFHLDIKIMRGAVRGGTKAPTRVPFAGANDGWELYPRLRALLFARKGSINVHLIAAFGAWHVAVTAFAI